MSIEDSNELLQGAFQGRARERQTGNSLFFSLLSQEHARTRERERGEIKPLKYTARSNAEYVKISESTRLGSFVLYYH